MWQRSIALKLIVIDVSLSLWAHPAKRSLLVHILKRSLVLEHSIVVIQDVLDRAIEVVHSSKFSTILRLHQFAKNTAHWGSHQRIESEADWLMKSNV